MEKYTKEEKYGNIAFVPHDVQYSWEITQEEFNFLIKDIYGK